MFSKFGLQQNRSKAEKVAYLGGYITGLGGDPEKMMVRELVGGEGRIEYDGSTSYEDEERETFGHDYCDEDGRSDGM